MSELKVIAWQCDWLDCAKISEMFIDDNSYYHAIPQVSNWIVIDVVKRPTIGNDGWSNIYHFCCVECRDKWIVRHGSSYKRAELRYPYSESKIEEYYVVNDG